MLYELRPTDPVDAYELLGEIDISCAEDVLTELLKTLPRHGDLVIDLWNLTFVDAAGIHALTRVAERMDGGRLVLCRPRGLVRKVFELTGVPEHPGVEIDWVGRRLAVALHGEGPGAALRLAELREATWSAMLRSLEVTWAARDLAAVARDARETSARTRATIRSREATAA